MKRSRGQQPPETPQRIRLRAKVADRQVPQADKNHPLLMHPPCTCNSCGQNTHEYEKDLLPDVEQYLKWHKIKDKKPYGHECYVCFDTRRRFFGDTQEVLEAARKTSQDVILCGTRLDTIIVAMCACLSSFGVDFERPISHASMSYRLYRLACNGKYETRGPCSSIYHDRFLYSGGRSMSVGRAAERPRQLVATSLPTMGEPQSTVFLRNDMKTSLKPSRKVISLTSLRLPRLEISSTRLTTIRLTTLRVRSSWSAALGRQAYLVFAWSIRSLAYPTNLRGALVLAQPSFARKIDTMAI